MKLSKSEINKKLSDLDGWELQDTQIQKQYSCKNFSSAVHYVNLIAGLAEKMDHHPDLFIHHYNKLTVTTTTHSENGLTNKDFELAEKVDQFHKYVI